MFISIAPRSCQLGKFLEVLHQIRCFFNAKSLPGTLLSPATSHLVTPLAMLRKEQRVVAPMFFHLSINFGDTFELCLTYNFHLQTMRYLGQTSNWSHKTKSLSSLKYRPSQCMDFQCKPYGEQNCLILRKRKTYSHLILFYWGIKDFNLINKVAGDWWNFGFRMERFHFLPSLETNYFFFDINACIWKSSIHNSTEVCLTSLKATAKIHYIKTALLIWICPGCLFDW